MEFFIIANKLYNKDNIPVIADNSHGSSSTIIAILYSTITKMKKIFKQFNYFLDNACALLYCLNRKMHVKIVLFCWLDI